MKSPLPAKNFYPALDGVRGVAIILVLVCHNFGFLPFARFGEKGVDLFFVLSGFLITEILLQAKGKRHFLSDFFIRRALRIFPVYYLCLVLFFILAPHLPALDFQYQYCKDNQGFLWLQMQNWLYIFHQFPGSGFMFSHFWSLSIEEQFYLFWPVCLLLARNTRNLKVFVYIVFSLLVLSRLVNVVFLSPGYTSYQLHYMTHADGLCIGSLIAIFKYEGVEDIFRRLARLFGWVIGSHLIMLVLGKLAFSDLPHMPVFSYAETALLFGMLVTFCIVPLPRSRVTTLMTNKPLRYLGRISYGLYVYHRPILVLSKLFVAAYLERFIPNGTILSLIAAFIALIAAMVLSTASFYFIERPILSVKSKLTTSGILAVLRKRLPFLPRIAFTK